MHLQLQPHLTAFAVPTTIPDHQMQFQFWFRFLSSLGYVLGSSSGPKSAPKLVEQLIMFGSIFGTLLLEVLKLFKCLLGAFLSLLWASWEIPMPSLGPSRRLLAQLNPKMAPNKCNMLIKMRKTNPGIAPVVDQILGKCWTTVGVHSGAKNSTVQITSYHFPMQKQYFCMFKINRKYGSTFGPVLCEIWGQWLVPRSAPKLVQQCHSLPTFETLCFDVLKIFRCLLELLLSLLWSSWKNPSLEKYCCCIWKPHCL